MRGELRPEECQTRIVGDRGFAWQCQKKPVVTRDGKLYCKIHDPEYVAEKHRKWQEKYDKENNHIELLQKIKQTRYYYTGLIKSNGNKYSAA